MPTTNNRIALFVAIALVAATLVSGAAICAEYIQAGTDYLDNLKRNAAAVGQHL